jgi:TRAP-type C4-dicarboxylate transport system permease small subunit
MSWNIDMAMLLLAWTAFLGADIAYRSGQLVGVDLVTRKLPLRIQVLVEILVFLVILIALCMIVYFGIRLALVEKLRRFQSIRIPYSIVTMSIVLASASMAVSTVIKIKHRVLSLVRKDTGSQPA